MATIRDYFDTDFPHDLLVHRPMNVHLLDGESEGGIIARLHYNCDSNAKYVSYYLPPSAHLFDICGYLLSNLNVAFSVAEGVKVGGGWVGQVMVWDSELLFTGRVFVYHDGKLTPEQTSLLQGLAVQHGIALRLRGPEYSAERSAVEKPIAFICHDSRDKDEVARPLAIKLSALMCPVWFDEFSLKVGDSLREEIERGLKECKKCVIILSPSFFGNEGWTRREFDSIFTRELVEKNCFILPVWYNVDKKQVFEYCPSLADKFAVLWSLGVEEVARRLYKAI
jgi:hypothetical protein